METPTHAHPPVPPLPPRRPFSRHDALTILFLALSLLGALAMTRLGMLHGNDFKHLWLGARLLSQHSNPYDVQQLMHEARRAGMESVNPFVYLPTTGLLLQPLAETPWSQAMLFWFWLNWVVAWGVVLAGPWALRVPRPALARLAGAAFLAGSLPFYRQQTAGQMNVLTAALLLCAAAGLLRNKNWLTGAALALGWGWKLAPGLLVAALAPLRRWRALAWAAAGCAALLALSIIVYGVEVHRAALPVLRQMGYGKSTWAEFGEDFYRQPFNQSPNAFFHHILTENPYTRPWLNATSALANGATVAFSLTLAALWLWAAWRRNCGLRPLGARTSRPLSPSSAESLPSSGINPPSQVSNSDSCLLSPDSCNPHSAFSIPHSTLPLFLAASLAMLLLPSLMWDHYVVQALPVLIWIFGQPATARSPWRAALALACLAALTLPVQHGAWNQGIGILIMSLRLWPILALYAWLLFDRRLAASE